MKHTFTDPDLIELDRTWPIGQMLDVPENGTIVVAGAYKGRYMHYLSELFPTAYLIGFEPRQSVMVEAQKRLGARIGALLKIQFFNQGLATADRFSVMGRADSDGASVVEVGGEHCDVQMVDAVEALQSFNPIDLLLLNMEGSEWALIPYLLDEMMHHRIASIALQQHTKYASKERISRVWSYLAEYYDLVYSDGKLDGWSYWRRK